MTSLKLLKGWRSDGAVLSGYRLNPARVWLVIVKYGRKMAIWPHVSAAVGRFAGSATQLSRVLAYERGVGFSLSTCEWGRSFLARG